MTYSAQFENIDEPTLPIHAMYEQLQKQNLVLLATSKIGRFTTVTASGSPELFGYFRNCVTGWLAFNVPASGVLTANDFTVRYYTRD